MAGGNHSSTTTDRLQTRANTGSGLAHARQTNQIETENREAVKGQKRGDGRSSARALALTGIDPFLLTKADPLGGLGECPLQAWWSLRRQGKYPGR